ncbi:PKD domain-containing protein [bacterium]|nr:PKD domain-containing protein [bacterium]
MKTAMLKKILWIISCVGFLGCDKLGNLGKDSEKPVIDRITIDPPAILVNDTTSITVEARDLNDEDISYVWNNFSQGTFIGSTTGETILWKAPAVAGNYPIRVTVTNESGRSTSRTDTVEVIAQNTPVVIITNPMNGAFISAGLGAVTVAAQATPTDIDSMTFAVGNVVLDRALGSSANFVWNIASLSGSQILRVKAYRHSGPQQFVGETSISVSIESVVGKRK